MSIVPVIKPNDWPSVRQALQRIASIRLGETAEPTFDQATVSILNIGNAEVSGAWRMIEVGDNLEVQRLIGTTWTVAFKIKGA